MIRPVVNRPGRGRRAVAALGRRDHDGGHLCRGRARRARLYPDHGEGRAEECFIDIRQRSLCPPAERCRCAFSTRSRHGDVMSYFTNDVDTISDALNNSFAMVIQSFIQMVGTLADPLHPELAAFPDRYRVLCGRCFSTSASAASGAKPITPSSRTAWESWTAILRRWSAGQKVVKVFNHEEENLQGFREKNESSAGKRARAPRATRPP